MAQKDSLINTWQQIRRIEEIKKVKAESEIVIKQYLLTFRSLIPFWAF